MIINKLFYKILVRNEEMTLKRVIFSLENIRASFFVTMDWPGMRTI